MTATKRSKTDRVQNDSYYTPSFAVDLIFNEIKVNDVSSSLEPCRGNSIIYDRLPGERYYAEISEGIDYLSTLFPPIDLIITNPPFSLAMEFLEKSITEAKTVVYLLRLTFVSSVKRSEFFQKYPPTHLFVLANRPSFRSEGGTDRTEYAWFCWDRGNFICNSPGIHVLVKPTKSTDLDYVDPEAISSKKVGKTIGDSNLESNLDLFR